VRSRAPTVETKTPQILLPESPGVSGAPVGFINPGSLTNRLPHKGSAQADSTQLMARPKSLKQHVKRAVQPPTERSSQGGTAPACRLQPTSMTGALTSVSSRLRTVSPIGRPGKALPPTPTGVCQDPAHRSSPTGTIRADLDQPTGDARSVGTRRHVEKSKARRTRQNTIP
jgi:hypothetical protein